MKKKFKIIIKLIDLERVFSRILIILNRRNIHIFSLKAFPKVKTNIVNCSFEVKVSEVHIKKLIQQIEKQIGVISILYLESKKEKYIPPIKVNKPVYSKSIIRL